MSPQSIPQVDAEKKHTRGKSEPYAREEQVVPSSTWHGRHQSNRGKRSVVIRGPFERDTEPGQKRVRVKGERNITEPRLSGFLDDYVPDAVQPPGVFVPGLTYAVPAMPLVVDHQTVVALPGTSPTVVTTPDGSLAGVIAEPAAGAACLAPPVPMGAAVPLEQVRQTFGALDIGALAAGVVKAGGVPVRTLLTLLVRRVADELESAGYGHLAAVVATADDFDHTSLDAGRRALAADLQATLADDVLAKLSPEVRALLWPSGIGPRDAGTAAAPPEPPVVSSSPAPSPRPITWLTPSQPRAEKTTADVLVARILKTVQPRSPELADAISSACSWCPTVEAVYEAIRGLLDANPATSVADHLPPWLLLTLGRLPVASRAPYNFNGALFHLTLDGADAERFAWLLWMRAVDLAPEGLTPTADGLLRRIMLDAASKADLLG